MAFRIKVKDEDPDEVNLNTLLSRREHYSEINPKKFGFAAGIVVAFCILTVSVLSSFGVFSGLLADILQMYGLNSDFGFFGVFIAMVYSFFSVFVFTAIFAMLYNLFL